MTCSTMLELLLEADLEEMRTAADTPVAAHLRDCARCRSLLDHLVQDTNALRQVVHSRRAMKPVRSRAHDVARRAWTIGLVGVAATILSLMTRGERVVNGGGAASTIVGQPVGALPSEPRPTLEPPSASRNLTAPLPNTRQPALAARSGRPPRRRALARAVVPVAVKVEPTLAIPADPAVPVKPVRLDAPPRPALGDGVSAEPSVGRRANIIRTGRPDVTVVWLY